MRVLWACLMLLAAASAEELRLQPRQEHVPCRQSIQFRVAGWEAARIRWQVDRGTIDETGLFLAPAEPGPCQVRASDRQDLRSSATWTVRAVAVDLQAPSTLSLRVRQESRIPVRLAFRGGELDGTLQWTLQAAAAEDEGQAAPGRPHDGHVDPTGWVRAPSREGSYAVTIALAADPRVKAAVMLQVIRPRAGRLNDQGQPVSVKVQAAEGTVRAGAFTFLNCQLDGAEAEAVEWQVIGNPKDAECDAQGVFRATRPGVYRIRATSVQYPDCFGETSLEVHPDITPVKEEESAKADRLGITLVQETSGSYLLVGGWKDGLPVPEVQRFQSPEGRIASLLRLQTPRAKCLAVVLSDQTVLVVGGLGSKGGQLLRDAEQFDPVRGVSWKVGTPRWHHAGGLLQPLPNRCALLAGGVDPDGRPCGAEWFDGATGAFKVLEERPWPARAASLKLPEGPILVLGGELGGRPSDLVWRIEPPGLSITPLGKLGQARTRHTATLLPDQRTVLLIGGRGRSGTLATAELFDLATSRSRPGGHLAAPREGHAALLLPTGMVMVLGGGEGLRASRLHEHWNPDTLSFDLVSRLDHGLKEPRLFLNLDGGTFVYGQVEGAVSEGTLPGSWGMLD